MKVILIILALIGVSLGATYTEITNLRTALVNAYGYGDPMYRPSERITVGVNLHLLGISNLDAIEETLTVIAWLTVMWDSTVAWNPGSFNNIQYLHVKHGEIWRPDLVIENAATQPRVLSDDTVSYRLNNTGIITWEIPVSLNVHCHMDLKFYPMDKQTCSISISSWSYPKDEVILVAYNNKINLELLSENIEWDVDVELRTVKTDIVTTSTLDRSFSRLTFYITMSRNSAFLGVHMILPLVLISGLLSLMFVLPSHTGEKVSYSITTYLINVILYISVIYYLPLSSLETSIIGIYYTVILCWDTLAILLSCMVTLIHNRQTDMSGSSKYILTLLKRLTCSTNRDDVTSTLSQGTESTTVSLPDLHACSTLPNGDVKQYKRHGRLSPINRRVEPEPIEPSTATNMSPEADSDIEQDTPQATGSNLDNDMSLPSTRHRKIGPIVKRETIHDSLENRPSSQWIEMAGCLDTVFLIVFMFVSFVIHLAFIVTLLVAD